MLDNDLINLVSSYLDAASAQAGWGYPVIQKNQPSAQGIPYMPAIFLEKLFDHHYGSPAISYLYVGATDTFTTTEEQVVETTFQISALAIQDPNDLTIPTASDIANYMKQYLTSRPVIRDMFSNGVAPYRVTDVRNPYFGDERERYEANPSFDIVCVHSRPITATVGATDTVIGEVVTGFEGEGTFPVPDDPS